MSGLQSRRLWLNLLMLLLVVGLSGLAWWLVNKPQHGEELLYSESPDAIKLITLERPSELEEARKIRFELQEGYWWMVAPRKIMANGVRLRQLFTFLNEEVVASYDAAGKDLKQYGLSPGKVTLRFNEQQYVLGINNAVSNNRYVLHKNKIKLVSEAIYGSVTGDWVNFVSLRLLPEGRQVQSVSLPQGYEQTSDLASSWQNADAIRLEPMDSVSQAPGGAGEIVVTFVGGEQMSFWVMGKGDELELAQTDSGIRYFIPETQAGYLLPPADDEGADRSPSDSNE